MKKRNLFFDLDGTIIDSYPGISNSVNYAARKLGSPELPDELLRKFIGPPLVDSFMKYMECDRDKANEYLEAYREYYRVQGIYEFLLFGGIYEAIKTLSKSYSLYVTTSKPKVFTEIILKKAELFNDFCYISGADLEGKHNSKADIVNYVINKFSLKAEECALIGDTGFDGEGAQIAGIDFYAVSYGFGTMEELLSYKPVKIFDTAYAMTKYFEGEKDGN